MEKLTSPSKWEKVLENYSKLILNLAHFGKHNHSNEWQKKILELIINYPNVYSDISHRGFNDDFYKDLKEVINSYEDGAIREKIKTRILFGSDFMINLLKIDSYCQYFDFFSKTKHFTTDEKNYFCSINPRRFLFKNQISQLRPNSLYKVSS